MKNELRIFWTAVMFYTRRPCPKSTDHDPDYINKATRYFPLIGWIVGFISALIYLIFNYVLGSEIAIVLSIISSILVTGAFHEDGFADVCDGFGGGWTKEKILTIMKDSAIGAYGAIGIVLLFVLKLISIYKLFQVFDIAGLNNYSPVFLLLIAAHSISRLTAVSIVFTHNYSRDDASSKSKPIAQKATWREVFGAFFFGLIPFFILCSLNYKLLLVLIPLFLTRFFMVRYFQKWIDGYTGDCLGAVQQVSEVIFYLSILVLWRFI